MPHIVDMRDGWLDEPIKPLLHTSAFRRWQEGRLESRILRDASSILVTSDVWLDLLCKRLPELTNKVTVLTNGYPPATPQIEQKESMREVASLLLVHAGRFSGSDIKRTPDLILQPLLEEIKRKASQGTIKLIGALSEDELEIIARFSAPFAALGWRIECPGSLPRAELLQLLPKADGLLLLSASYAAIPSKLFEYIPTGRPMLVVTERRSATWRICEKLPQATLVETAGQANNLQAQRYLDAVLSTALKPVCPDEFTEDHLSGIMRHVISEISGRKVALDTCV